ncbi:MAG: hypothetical protein LUG93_12625 [Lachnospiraceae bacterium]|nr:hypothetical protein [Lachnospiraceae bacterium]
MISRYLPIGAVLIPAAFILPAFYCYGIEVGILAVILALVMLQRHMPGLKNIPSGTEPRKDLLKALRRKDNQ